MRDITIKALESDEEIRQKAFVSYKGWQEAYGKILDQSFLDTLTYERNLKNAAAWKDMTIIAKDDENVIGFAVCGPCRDEDHREAGEVYALYILKAYYDQKVGYRLMQAALNQLAAYPEVIIWVLKENKRAIRFYQRCGFRFDGMEKELPLGKPVPDARMILLPGGDRSDDN